MANGLYKVYHRDGTFGFTHGPDPVPPGARGLADGEVHVDTHGHEGHPDAPVCRASGDAYYNLAIYARATDDADNYATIAAQYRNVIHEVNGHLVQEAAKFGATREFEFHCTGGVVTVHNEVLPTAKAEADFDSIVSDLRAKGYNDAKVKYWIYYDDTGACSCAGQGHVNNDDRDSVNNRNNGNSGFSTFAVTYGYMDVRVVMHENGHNLGAVQLSAPNDSGGWHCNDGSDIMCYADGGSRECTTGGSRCVNTCFDLMHYDCGHDDYFHPSPASGSYLDTHWNIGATYNRYIWPGVLPNEAPSMVSLSCTPNPSDVGTSVTCSFRATDDSTGVYYRVDWGDGSGTTRVPSSGTVAPGSTRSASHVYASVGSFTVSVTATDNAAVPLTSSPRTTTQTVVVGNAAPVMQALSCSPNPSTAGESVTCSFRATDDSSGVFYTVEWGDGSGTTRVPSSGTVAPGGTQTAAHTYTAAGSFTVSVTATDNAASPRTSTARTTTQTVDAANAAPVMADLYCTPSPSTAGEAATCWFYATDASSGVYYTVDWGDGSGSTRAPASGTTAPGNYVSAVHTWASAGTFAVSVTATDNDASPLTSSARTTSHTVQAANAAPVMQALSCAPNPSAAGDAVSCSFHATDDSTGVSYVVEWGDGSGSTRVPASGTVAPGSTQAASHTFASAGSFTVSVIATDNAAAPRASAARTATQTVEAVNAAPAMADLYCTPSPSNTGQSASCWFYATDDSSGVYYTIDWGDGSGTARAPASGTTGPGNYVSAAHTWSAAGSFTVTVRATDNAATPLTSSALTATQTVQAANAAPVMQTVSCAPNPSTAGDAVTCSFHATDDSTGVHYSVDWGDGSGSVRVPASGTVAPGTSQSGSHTFTTHGAFTVSVTATDNAASPLTSTARSFTQTVEAVSATPVMQALSCSPNPSTVGDAVSCSFHATDDSSGVHYVVDWGDGSATARVPASGVVAPGGAQTATHTFSTVASFTVSVTATDNAASPRTSAARSVVQDVHAANDAPSVTTLTCAPNPSIAGDVVSCSFQASDDSTGVAYTVDWGDGSAATRVPASGTVAPGTSQNAGHTFAAAGTFTVSVTATDNAASPLTSEARSVTQSVEPANVAPVIGNLYCTPEPADAGDTVSCWFFATDDSAGVYYHVDWGDGSAVARVPSSGTVAPGGYVSQTHVWATAGSFNVIVTATDDGSPALTSSPQAWAQSILVGNEAPRLQALACSPDPSTVGDSVSCSFHATDDSTGVAYTVDWGDGSAVVRVPASGTVAPGASQSAVHVYAADGSFTVTVTATDDGTPPLTSLDRTLALTVQPPPCVLDRAGTLVAGLAGRDVQDVSARDEAGVPSWCWGHFFQLSGGQGADFNVCWYQGAAQLACYTNLGPESGFIPYGADRARVLLFVGALSDYRLVGAPAADDGGVAAHPNAPQRGHRP